MWASVAGLKMDVRGLKGSVGVETAVLGAGESRFETVWVLLNG